MNFSIVRQTLGQALMMLLVFATLAATATRGGGDAAVLPATAHGMALPLPGEWLAYVQSAFPHAAGIAAWVCFVLAGLTVGRLTTRYNIYSTGTFMAISLFALFGCGLSRGEEVLQVFLPAALFVFSCRNFAGSIINGYSFDAIFRGSLYLGLLPLVDSGGAVLLPLLPVALLLFRRTSREAVVALFGVLLPLMAFSYLNWALGGDFRAPMYYIIRALTRGGFFSLIGALPVQTLVLAGLLAAGNVVAGVLFLNNLYSMSNRVRHILIYNLIATLFVVGAALLPSASPAMVVLFAATSAVALPLLFLRMNPWVATVLYAVVAVLSCLNILL